MSVGHASMKKTSNIYIETSEVLLAVEFVDSEVVRGKLLTTGTKAFLLVSVLLRMFDIFLCLSFAGQSRGKKKSRKTSCIVH
jgi:hypothetical protein